MASVESPAQTINKFRSIVAMLSDPTVKDDLKLKATQEISESFEQFLSSTVYQSFLDHLIKVFLKVLQEGEPHFIAEYNIQQVRKLMLEMLYRLPTNEALRPYVKPILSLALKLLEVDNEENVLVCLKIIIELHKQFRPAYNTELQHFLQFVKNMYSELPTHIDKIFEPKPPIRVKDLSDLNMEELLKDTFTVTMIQTEQRKPDQTTLSYNLIPKAVLSLKVIADLPIIVVLMYQLYKQSVYKDVSDFIPLIMTTITLQPTLAQRQSESFNKEIFVDFMGAQIKTLSFLAYIIKIYQDVVANHSGMLVQGMLGLLTLCPMEVAHLRRELLIASRHILATELRNKFVPHMERLFDEDVLLGRGWTTHESLRPLAYSTLADLVHHVRTQLTLANITRAVHLFSKNVHDDTLATTIQTMSCKLLLNLVDCIRHRAEIENAPEGKDLLMRMLEVFVLKFKTIAKIQLPRMIERYKQQQAAAATNPMQQGIDIKSEVDLRTQQETLEANLMGQIAPREERTKFGFPQTPTYNVSDYRSLVKTLVCGVKTITWGYATCKPITTVNTKQFSSQETLVFIRLVKWALKALDVYTVSCSPLTTGQARLAQQTVRSKEEKEVLEHFSTVFTMMNAQTFHEIFSTTIEYIVERVYKNSTLQIIPNTLLANPATSPIFSTVLVEYLLERMEEMGSNLERSNLYLRLFKLVFGSVSLFPQENENMLRPHLHQIVNRSMELAMAAKEPYNYFLLLRALFRSIGGGSHDLLYQEFLPLLPNLLEGLNRLQSGLHKVHMKDLFVELCLTVPVRLSSLLPYLPMLMDPLVSALNGSNELISQGLRTLELCVDNLQHDFLYEHIQPVRAELMQALWRTLRNNTQEQIAQVAFKVLGKFGGGNRKMMTEPQRLEYISSDQDPPAVTAYFKEQQKAIQFPVQKIIETAFNALKQSKTDSYYRKQAWEAIHCYLAASLDLSDDKNTLTNLFMHCSYQDGTMIVTVKGSSYKSIYKQARETHQTALIGMFVAAAIKELRYPALHTMYAIVRHYTMVAVAQEAGTFAVTPKSNEQIPLDPMVLVDALFVIMGHEEKELCKPGEYALRLIVNTATYLLGSKDLACRLPFIEYLSERMCSLCYERAWYAKLGGCKAIEVMLERCAKKWVYEHTFTFLKALLFVMMDLTGEVSSGALDSAKQNLEKLLTVCVTPIDGADASSRELQTKALNKVVHELVRQVTSPHTLVREQCMASLKLIAEKKGVSVTEVMEPFKEILADMVPPRKHLLKHQPANAQMGLMDGNMFCTSLSPRLFSIDMSVKEHKLFITDLISLCSTEDAKLLNFSCYKNITNFIPLRVSALRALAACHYLEAEVREAIFHVLYKTLEGPNPELQMTAYECMKVFIGGYQMEKDIVHKTMRPLLMTLGDVKALTLNGIKMLSYLTRLFPKAFNEKLCEQLMEILKQLMEHLVNVPKASTGISKKGEDEQKIITVISIFHQTPAASSKFIKQLCQYVLQTEQALYVEASSPFREELMKFLKQYPSETLDMFLEDGCIKEPQFGRYLHYLIKHKEGKIFRDLLQTKMLPRLITLALSNININIAQTQVDRNEFQYQAVRIVSLLIKYDDQWLSGQHDLIDAFKRVWSSDEYQERNKKIEAMDYNHWREPKLLVKVLLHYFCHHPNDIDLLFELLRATTDRFIPDFQFLRDFLENTVAQNYTVEWKRSAFFKFVEHFTAEDMSQELIAKILQLVIIPCFAVGFERGETDKLIGTPPAPYHDHPDNIVSVFLNRCFAQVVDPDSPFPFADCVRISLLQFSCLLVEQASPHIHDRDATNKTQGFKLRRLMTFAWPCLLGKNCVDAATRYHGHLLLSHIIDKFAIHRKIVLQVFHSLLKAHGLEARGVVRQALEILTPSMPLRMEEGHKMLTHWTKKIIVDEGHSIQQLFHILQLVVKHYKVYYPVRHHLVQYMVNSIQRLGFSPTASLEHKRLAVELAEVIIKWELNGIKEEDPTPTQQSPNTLLEVKKTEELDTRKKQTQLIPIASTSSTIIATKPDLEASKPIEKMHIDMVLNSLMRLACQVNDTASANAQTVLGIPQGEMLSRRCVSLLKTALKPELWPFTIDINFAYYDKLLQTLEGTSPNFNNVCTGLELLTYLVGVLKKEQILSGFKLLQRRLGACVTQANSKVIKTMHTLLQKLMSIFPSERTNANMSCKHEELEVLYSTVGKNIFEGLSNYEKSQASATSMLFGPLMMLKAACANNNSYIDLLITPFMRVLQKLQKEHLTPTSPESNLITSELLIIALDLVKTRVVVMGVEMRKSFIGSILVGLIEKTPDVKVMKAITKMLEEWMKNKNVVTLSQAPSLREKSILLVKMMQYVEKRFPDEMELNSQFLELVNYVYSDEQLRQSELISKLEQAFLAGLRSPQPHIRAKFFKVFDESMRRRLHDRVLYIICSQNWDAIGPHYWIKQCIELLLSTASADGAIRMSHESCILPSITSVINQADANKREEFYSFQTENPNFFEAMDIKEEVIDMDLSNGDVTNADDKVPNRAEKVMKIISEHAKFIESCRGVTPDQFFTATAQLCHMDTALAENVWLQLFPRIWEIFDDQQRVAIQQDISGFLTSGTHMSQKDCHPSAMNTFVEAVCRCNPPIPIAPPIMKYLGKSHNLWHRLTLGLEQMAFDPALKQSNPFDFEPDQNQRNEIHTALHEMYTSLCEEDMWAGLWQKFAYYRDTNTAIAYEQHGFFEQAQVGYEACFNKYKQEYSVGPVPTVTQKEVCMWIERYSRCTKELNQWSTLAEYSKHSHYNAYMLLDSAWRVPNWDWMKEALANVEYSYHKELAWKVTLYGGYILICNPEPEKPLKFAERYVETATTLCLNEWRRLPTIVSHIHIQYLQAAQQIMELQEAYQIHKGLTQGHTNSLHDMKAIVKTWRNRLPVIADDLSHWNDIFTWRQQHYQFIVHHYENLRETSHANSMLGVHASAQSIIHFGKIARKHKLTAVCQESLNRIHTITSVHIVDCFQKIRQQVKCYLQMASMSNNRNELQEGLEVINNTNVKYFTKEMTAEFYAMKGLLFHLSNKADDANKSFSVAIQLHDTSVKAWALYGEYLEQVFTRDPRQIALGSNAIVCFLHACRIQNESKARKYLAKILWLLTYDDDKGTLMDSLDKYCVGVPPIAWVPWIPQLLNCLVFYDGNVILNLLCQVGRMFPQAVYFPIRTLYLTLRTATARKTNVQTQPAESQTDQPSTSQNQDGASSATTQTATGQHVSSEAAAIKASPPLVRCSKIMKLLRDIHTTVLSSLEGIADQMEWFRENWYEEVLRQLRHGLAKCYAIAFENRESVNEAKITPHILNFVKKLVSTFGIGVENIQSSANTVFHSAASESLARRAEATYQDPVFKEMKLEFAKDFDFSQQNAIKLHTLIFKLKKWIKILENRSKVLIQSFLIEEKCRYLANFTQKTGEVEIPGEFLLPKHAHYFVRIARFMPRVDVVQKHNTAARRLYIRGHNGKIYPYLVVNDSGLAEARREERVLQLLRMLNHYLGKQKETAKRFLNFTVPRVVAVSQQIRLIEDNPASISLLDIFKHGCSKLSIEHDAPIHHYYERLANVQSRGIKASHQVYREILKGVQGNMVPRNLLKQWACATFPSATDYWQFRKMFTLQLALACFVEYVFHLTRLNPDMMYLHQDSGLMNVAYFKFDVDDSTGELDTTRPVPFRLTPNIAEFLSPIGISGPLTASMIATARCFVYPNFKLFSILRPILKDEMVLSRIKKNEDPEIKEERLNDNEQLINMVNRAVTSITNRLNSLAHFDGVDSKVATLVTAASSHDNLCRMDPAWHPWL